MEALPEFLAQTDILVCLLPLTDETRGILNCGFVRAPAARRSLVNVGRGGHLVEADFIAALDTRRVVGCRPRCRRAGAAAGGSSFWSHPRILVTPHNASMTTPETAVDFVLDVIARHRRGEDCRGLSIAVVVTEDAMMMVASVQPRTRLTSPACGRGRRVAPGEGSLLLGVLAGGSTLSRPSPASGGGGAPRLGHARDFSHEHRRKCIRASRCQSAVAGAVGFGPDDVLHARAAMESGRAQRVVRYCLAGNGGDRRRVGLGQERHRAVDHAAPSAANGRVEGSILLAGRDLLTLPEAQMRDVRGNEIAMIFQEPMTSLNPVLTIGFQIAEALIYHRGLIARAGGGRDHAPARARAHPGGAIALRTSIRTASPAACASA